MDARTPDVIPLDELADAQRIAPRWSGTRVLIAAVVVALLHFVWLRLHFAPAIMSADANGYVVQARLIANSGRTWFSTDSPAQYVGVHWLETAPGVFHSRYPVGWPLLLAAAWKVGGLDAALTVNQLLASATVLLVFLLGRRFMPAWAALLASVVVALAPIANQHALDADAHTAATFLLVAGVYALLTFAETRRVGVGVLAGLLLGLIPTVRYPEAIVGLTVAAWLAWRIRPLWRAWPAVVGAAVPVLALAIHNAAAYGAFWRTGYALTNEQTGFGIEYFTAHAVSYLENLSGHGLALFFGFGAAGLAAMMTDAKRRAEGVLFAGIVVPLVLLYMAYYFGGGPAGSGAGVGNLRFLVPTFPFFALAAAWLLGRITDALGQAGVAVTIAVACVQVVIAATASTQTLAQSKSTLTAAAAMRTLAEKSAPAGSVLIVDRQLAESLDAVGRWKLVEQTLVVGGAPGARGLAGPGPGVGAGPAGARNLRGRSPDAPSPMQAGKNQAQREHYATSSPVERRGLVWADLAEWAGTQPVFCFSRTPSLPGGLLPPGTDSRRVGEVDAPLMGGLGAPRMAMGAGGATGGGPMGRMPAAGRSVAFPAGGNFDFAGRAGAPTVGTKLYLLQLTLPARPLTP